MIFAADIGTTILKAGLICNDGTIVRLSSCRLNTTQTLIDPSIWLKALYECTEELKVQNSHIDCIILSGNGPTLAPSETGNALLWTHRAEKESEEIEQKTGLKLMPSMFLPKALFIKNNMPDVYRSNSFFLSSAEYVSYKLTGKARTTMPLQGLEKWYWNNNVLRTLNLDESKFPDFVKTGELLGFVTENASLIFNLKQGTPVLAGCPDFVAAIVGSGAMHQGQICNRSGTGEGINYCAAKPVENPVYMCYRHPNNTDWNISTVIPNSGSLIDAAKGTMSYSEFFKTEKCKKICTDICNNIKNAIHDVANGPVEEIRLTGGPSKSEAFNQMRANICNCKITTVDSPEAGISGLGVIAVSSLEKRDIKDTADKLIKVKKTYFPMSN